MRRLKAQTGRNGRQHPKECQYDDEGVARVLRQYRQGQTTVECNFIRVLAYEARQLHSQSAYRSPHRLGGCSMAASAERRSGRGHQRFARNDVPKGTKILPDVGEELLH